MTRNRLAAAAALLSLCAAAHAAPIAMSAVRAMPGSFGGITVDSTTGVVYETRGYSGTTTIYRYADTAAFEAGISDGTAAFAGGLFGTYFAARDGTLYGRSGTSTGTTVSTAGAGAPASANAAGMGGANGSDTFDWGGYSGVNVMNDGHRLYVVGGDATSALWRIATYDYALNLLGNVTFAFNEAGSCTTAPSNPGFGFAIEGRILLGDDYCNGGITTMVDAATGSVTAVDHQLTGFAGSYSYLTNAFYDARSDSLYVSDLGSGSYYKLAGAAGAFDIEVSAGAVPEPSALALSVLALAAAAAARRRPGMRR